MLFLLSKQDVNTCAFRFRTFADGGESTLGTYHSLSNPIGFLDNPDSLGYAFRAGTCG